MPSLIFYYWIVWFFSTKILKGNKSELNRRFNRRFNPGLKPAFFDFLPMFSRFPTSFPQNEHFAVLFFGWWFLIWIYFMFVHHFFQKFRSFFNTNRRNNIKFNRSLNRKPDFEFKSRYPRVFSNIQQNPHNFVSKSAFHSQTYILSIFVVASLLEWT